MVGSSVGEKVGEKFGLNDFFCDWAGLKDRRRVGRRDGPVVGSGDSARVGLLDTVGRRVGRRDGPKVRSADGVRVGLLVGLFE